MSSFIPIIYESPDDIIYDQIFDVIFNLTFKWSIDPVFRQNGCYLCMKKALQYLRISENRFPSIVHHILSKITRTTDWEMQIYMLDCLRIISSKCDDARIEVLSSGVLQELTMRTDPITSPSIVNALCEIFTALVIDSADTPFINGFDIVGRFQNVYDTCDPHVVFSALQCFGKLCTFSDFIRKRVFECNIINHDFRDYSFDVKVSFIYLLSQLMKGSFCDELMISEETVDTVVSVAESTNKSAALDSLYVLHCVYTNGYTGVIDLDLESLADDDNEEIAEAATQLIELLTAE